MRDKDMLTQEQVRKIEEFVYLKPRSVQEIAQHIGKNWRTADRYINEIEKSYGTIAMRVFREGTRGALKIVFWASVEKASHSVFQQNLEEDILKAHRKEDFSAFDIFQYINRRKKSAEMETSETESTAELTALLKTAEKRLLIFSGNLSFINLENKKLDLLYLFDELVKKGVSIKILCRVDIAGKENIERILSLNYKYGKEIIEIRHDEHPIRAFIVDSKVMRMKEVKEPTGKIRELNKKIFIYYTIRDKEWIEWMTKIFWKKFSSSIDSKKRLDELHLIKNR
jgi:hypothetical protein